MFSSLSTAIQSILLALTALTMSLFPSVSVHKDTAFPTAPTSGSPAPITQTGNGQSSNWAGYIATGGTFTGVSGSWTVPLPTSSNQTSADATWVGVGGVGSSDLVQVGTENSVQSGGQVSTSAFYELLPNGSQNMPGVSISPGDFVSVSITEPSSGRWTISFTDNTNGGNYSNTFDYTSQQASAEWIEEDPSDGVGNVPLDNFGKVSINAGSAIENGSTVSIGGANAKAVTMINSSGQAIATPSAIGSGGASFTVTRSTASSGPAVSGTGSSGGTWHRHGRGRVRTSVSAQNGNGSSSWRSDDSSDSNSGRGYGRYF